MQVVTVTSVFPFSAIVFLNLTLRARCARNGARLLGFHPIYKSKHLSDVCVVLTAHQGLKQPDEFRRSQHDSMKQKLNGLPQKYVAALRKHLKQGPRASLRPALGLGRQAVAFGLEMLELARIHERALNVLKPSGKKNGLLKQAEIFFAGAITPIVEADRTARQRKIQLARLNEALGRRKVELAATERTLRRGVARRKVIADAFTKNGSQNDKCLEESLLLQQSLRRLTHRVLAAQEAQRKQLSCELQDEIAQTLLGINVRLLSLKEKARSGAKGLKNEIASTQRLVLMSARAVRKFAHELDLHQPMQNNGRVTTP
jgi:hypothetical protein